MIIEGCTETGRARVFTDFFQVPTVSDVMAVVASRYKGCLVFVEHFSAVSAFIFEGHVVTCGDYQ
jgi:hypothetical protein